MIIRNILDELNVIYDCNQKEVEVATLGLANADLDYGYCTFLEDKKYLDTLSPYASVILTKDSLRKDLEEKGKVAIVVQEPRISFFKMHNALINNPDYVRKQFQTTIGDNCEISETAVIADNNVTIGSNVIIEDFVVIKENTVIKDDCILRTGTIIGGEGFEHKRTAGSDILSVKHLGGVIIEKGVELQQSNCVDKAIYPWDDTVIGEYTKTDNCVHIAHADKLGKRVFIAACACLSGRVSVGNDVWIGPGVTIINGISIGNNAKISIGSVVTEEVQADTRVTGNFAVEHKKFMNFIKKLATGK